MADQDKKTDSENEAKPSALPKILIAGFVAIVIVVETVIFFFMVPSADDVAYLAEARLINQVEASMNEDGEETLENENDTVDFSLGEYLVTFTPPGSDRNYSVEFDLFGIIYAKDEKKMEELYANKKARFEYRIMLEVRNATVEELRENQLGLIQRRIHATSIEVLKEGLEDDSQLPVLLGVSLPGYQVFEE